MRRIFDGQPREVAVLASIAFIVAVGFGVVIPALPIFTRSMGVTGTQVGLVISAFGVMRFIAGPVVGKIVDRIGERRILATGMFIAAITTGAAGLANTYSQLLFWRSIGGIGSAMFTVAAVALLLRVAPAHLRAQAQSLYQGGFLMGAIAGPAIGGLLASISLRMPFFAYAFGLILCMVIALVQLPKDQPDEKTTQGHEPGSTLSLREALRLRPYLTALVCAFATGWVIFGTRTAITPLFVDESLQEKPSWAGIAFAISAVAQASLLLYAGRHADRVSRRSALLIGNVIGVVGLVMIAFSTNLTLFLAGMAVSGVGAAFFGAPAAALVGDVIKGRGGSLVAIYGMAADMGSIAGPIVAGMLIDNVSYTAAFLIGLAVLVPAFFFILRLPDTGPAAWGPDGATKEV